jgi:hypothetical protein
MEEQLALQDITWPARQSESNAAKEKLHPSQRLANFETEFGQKKGK